MNGNENPADCALRELFPSDLLEHYLWWHGPDWLKNTPDYKPQQFSVPPNNVPAEGKEICLHTVTCSERSPIVPLNGCSNFTRLKGITAWMFRFIHNCCDGNKFTNSLSTSELISAEQYWLK